MSDRQIDSCRFIKNGITYHSSNYSKRKTSISFYALLNNKLFCEIRNIDRYSEEYISVNIFTSKGTLLSFINDQNIDKSDFFREAFDLLNRQPCIDFTIIDLSDYVSCNVRLSDIISRCILLPIVYTGGTLNVMVPILE